MHARVHVPQNVRDACGIQPIESQDKIKKKKKHFQPKKNKQTKKFDSQHVVGITTETVCKIYGTHANGMIVAT